MENLKTYADFDRQLKKWLFKMKLTLTIFLFCLTGAFASTYSQVTRLDITMKNGNMVELIKQIESKSEFFFYYQKQELGELDNLTVKAKNATVMEILDKALKGTPFDYSIIDRYIVVRKVGDTFGNDFLATTKENVAAQQRAVSGKVTDSNNQPLPGATISIKGTTQGTVTDMNGNYTLTNIPADATLVFSFVGMRTQEMSVGNQANINVTMEEETIGIEEVVAIGYGTVKKSDLTGSVGSVKGNDIATIPTSNVMQSLAGRTPGVYVMQQSGEPGTSLNVQIRGANSIRGSNEPLYVVDGFSISTGNLNMISNSEIESIEILKDASATAIYGSRGANGVVLITTKRGKSGITTVDFESSFGIQAIRKKFDLMNASEYAIFQNEVLVNDGSSPYFSQAEINSLGKGFDWQDLVFSTTPILNNSLSVSGGNDKTKFSISGSILDQQGIVKGTGFERYSLRANLNHEISKIFSIEYGASATKSIKENERSQGGNRGNSTIAAAIAAPPTLTPYNDDGSYKVLSLGHPFLASVVFNPLNFINEQKDIYENNLILANLALKFEPIDGLILKIYGGAENRESRNDYYRTTKFLNSQGDASVSVSNYLSLLNENTLSYNKTINEAHDISAVVGITYQDFVSKSLSGSGTGFLHDITETYALNSASSPGIPGSGYSKSVLLSYLGRINYSFNNKYLFTASIRADGSSKYSVGNKWGYFPSGAFAWKVIEESFMKDNDFIDDFKLRTSWGITGSQAINAYQTLTQLSAGNTAFGGNLYTTFAPGSQLPGDLKWESTEQINLGIDLAFLNFRHRITADFYLKNTRDLLNPVSLPSSVGYTNTIKNVGQIKNKGLELMLDSRVLTGKFKWNLSPNIAFNRNEVVKLYDGQDILTGAFNYTLIIDNGKILRGGQPLGVFFGYLTDGYDENGNEKYKDIEEDGVINELDKTIIGDPNPDFIYGLNSNMKYNNFELNLFIQGSYGNDILNVSGISTIDYAGGLNTLRDVYNNYWTPDNPDAKYPRPTKALIAKFSDRQIEDGSFLRLRNIQLSYHIPEKWNFNVFRNALIYVSGQNLMTLTRYSWWDPEINSSGQGIDHFSYPTQKTYSIGIKLSF